MHNELQTKGLNLLAAVKPRDRKHYHLIAMTLLIVSVCVATILGAQIVGLL